MSVRTTLEDRADLERMTELTVLVNSGALTTEIDEIVDDPELAV